MNSYLIRQSTPPTSFGTVYSSPSEAVSVACNEKPTYSQVAKGLSPTSSSSSSTSSSTTVATRKEASKSVLRPIGDELKDAHKMASDIEPTDARGVRHEEATTGSASPRNSTTPPIMDAIVPDGRDEAP